MVLLGWTVSHILGIKMTNFCQQVLQPQVLHALFYCNQNLFLGTSSLLRERLKRERGPEKPPRIGSTIIKKILHEVFVIWKIIMVEVGVTCVFNPLSIYYWVIMVESIFNTKQLQYRTSVDIRANVSENQTERCFWDFHSS